MVKKVSLQSILGQLGANLIEQIVLRMKYVWRPLLIFDVGIDGEIEICDPITGEATNSVIKVQAKATERPLQAETSETFEYTCEQRDLDYWLRGNAPVILIICRPDTDEAYWISLRDYFKDLGSQKARKILFDKNRDRFDTTCAIALKQLSLPKDSGIYFSPLLKTETLYTNLLKVASFAPTIFIAETEYRDHKEIRERFKSMGVKVGSEWIIKNKRIHAFYDLDEYPFNQICDLGTRESLDTTEWAESDSENTKHDFVQLLNLCLRERARLLGLWFSKEHGYYYFPASRDLRTRKVPYQSIKRQASREVFKQYMKKSNPQQRAYCRHSAFKGYFVEYGGEWFLEITPTYHFSSNGYDEDKYREERLKGIKRLERNPAVIGHLLMWVDYLRKPLLSLFASEYPFLCFGELAKVDVNAGIPDDIWYQAEESEEAKTLRAVVNQPSLFGL